MTIEALQSQLFVLKILSVSMSSRWNPRQEDYLRPGSRASKPSISGQTLVNNTAPMPSSGAWHSSSARKPSMEFSSSTPPLPWAEIDPLDDNCARYVLSVMVLYLRQTAAPESRLISSSNLAPDVSLHDFESVDIPTPTPDDHAYDSLPPRVSQSSRPLLKFKSSATSFQSSSGASGLGQFSRAFHFERTHMALVKSTMALNILISKFAGRIVYFLSASNWMIVFHRIRTKIHHLANTVEDNSDTVDLLLMTHSAMDRSRLVQVLHELSSLLVNMKKQAQAAVAIPLRLALWNWVERYPQEYNEAVRTRGKLEGSAERVFDLLYISNEPGRERALWPTLTILSSLWTDRLSTDYQIDIHSRTSNFMQLQKSSSHRKVCTFVSPYVTFTQSAQQDVRFVEDLVRHVNTHSKLSDVAFVCAIDMCRAGFRISPDGELPLRHLATDIAHEIKVWFAPWKHTVHDSATIDDYIGWIEAKTILGFA